ncbi:DUF397 domain-containing protein [Streptomyces sp. NBRC 110028]|uniref:DUF397 domain-containing protein n=1 Tax=Streptomyces sp. NBRC 110028 TaxID=1621260 RepID=UPI00099E24E2|nr:DUF397 domain-containing protein [Streptomyces sp. NBRC 110028]
MSSTPDLSHAVWVKSSYSGGNEGQCVEFAPDIAAAVGVVPVRDSKSPAGSILLFSIEVWRSFTAAVHGGELQDF